MQPPPHNPYDLLHRIFSQPRGWRGQGGHESVRRRIEGQKWVSLGHQRQLRTKRWKDTEEGKDPDTNAKGMAERDRDTDYRHLETEANMVPNRETSSSTHSPIPESLTPSTP